MNILTEDVVVEAGLDNKAISRIVIERERDGWTLEESYKPIEKGKLKLTFVKQKEAKNSKKSKKPKNSHNN